MTDKIIKFLPLKIIASLMYFIFVTLCLTYPLIFNMSNTMTVGGDQVYVVWILNWNIHAFTTNVLNIFNANIFFPYQNTLAYCDTFITSALLAFVPVKLFGEPLVAFNFNFIFALISLGFFTYLLSLYLTREHFASIISGTLVAFSDYTLTKYMHIQLTSIGWVPLSILFFIMFLDKKNYKYLIFSAAFFIIQMYNSFLPGYFIVFSCLFIFGFYFIKKKIKINELPFSKIFLITLLTFLVVMPIIIPYYQVAKEFNYVRDVRDSIQFANRPEYTLYPGSTTRLSSFLLNTVYKHDKGPFTYDGFMGAMFFILSIAAILYRIKHRKKNFQLFDVFLVIGLFGFVLSLGPVFQWGGHVIKHPFIIPLPYALFYYLVPGFNGLRNSARWEMLFLFSFSICVGIFMSKYYENKSNILKFLLTALICMLVLLEFKFPYTFYQIPTKEQFPKVYTYVNNLPKNAVISEFPIYNWGTFPSYNSENRREYYSTLGFWKTFNGTAGFNPPPWQEKATFLIKDFPGADSIKLLKNNGVNYIILHAWEFDSLHNGGNVVGSKKVPSGNEVVATLNKYSELKLMYSVNNDYVYEIK